ncbi:hypothetical protein ACHAPQ_012476, partial [Fusarium lateritium]
SQNIKARAKLEKEEEEAEAALKIAMARLARVRKQKRALKKKGDDLFARGMQSQEESGELMAEESSAVIDLQSLGCFDAIDWNSVYTDVPINRSSSRVTRH